LFKSVHHTVADKQHFRQEKTRHTKAVCLSRVSQVMTVNKV